MTCFINWRSNIFKFLVFILEHHHIGKHRWRFLFCYRLGWCFFIIFLFSNTIFLLATHLNRIFKYDHFSTFTVVNINFILNLSYLSLIFPSC